MRYREQGRPANQASSRDGRSSGGAERLNLKQEQRKIVRNAIYALLLCGAVFLISHLLLPQLVDLGDDGLESRLTFWAGTNLFVLLWLMYSVRLVSRGRFRSREDNRGSAYSRPSAAIAVAVANLQNTLEQSVLFMFTQLGLVLLLGADARPLLVASVVLFLTGRVTFLIGYPQGAAARSFGMALTAIPALFALLLGVVAVIGRLAT